ncbi:hypothetical protein [Saccharothrix sp. HUAS TT1]|uniref:hypothetical protein n=1 Tax=unclassified Saccharothrix TaxID=2593673 RepID=UPI00345C2357
MDDASPLGRFRVPVASSRRGPALRPRPGRLPVRRAGYPPGADDSGGGGVPGPRDSGVAPIGPVVPDRVPSTPPGC